MNTTIPAPSGPEPLPDQPLAITIPEPTYENARLRGLVRRAIPVIQHPEAYSRSVRRELATALAAALCAEAAVEPTEEPRPPHTDADAPEEWEPGCGEEWT